MKYFFRIIILFTFLNCTSQENKLANRDVVYYFKEAKKLEFKERNRQKLTIDSVTIAPEYVDSITKKMNYKGSVLLQDIKEKVLKSYYEDYLYLQQIQYKNKTYALYFTMLSLYDIEFIVFEYDRKNGDIKERINRKTFDLLKNVLKINWNYEEAPKNKLQEVAIFIKNNYLVFNLGGLYLSAYDLKNKVLLYKEENPHSISQLYDKEANKRWVVKNVHEKIENLIKE